MRIPLNWLKQLVPYEMSKGELAERMSMAGFEVESIDDLAQQVDGVVVGLIVETSKHPNADKLNVCQVKISDHETLQVVCGAKNARTGLYVAIAKLGTFLKEPSLTIKKSKIRGVESFGMICSSSELGISSEEDGIVELDKIISTNTNLGDPIADLFGLNEVIFDLAITANRPDGMSMIGIAREVAALSGETLILPKIINIYNHLKYEVDDSTKNILGSEGMICYAKINNIDNEDDNSSNIKENLNFAGINSVNYVVDITNFVMLEQGQPLHAYDADVLRELTGKEVTIESFKLRYAIHGEQFKALDEKTYNLKESNLIVTCNEHIVAIAGIIGGYESRVRSKTKSIWLEAAVFNPQVIRISAHSLGLRSESSNRFEKGVVRDLTLNSISRAIDFIVKFNRKANVEINFYCKNEIKIKPITLRREYINKVLGPLNKPTNQDLKQTNDSSVTTKYLNEEYLRDNTIEEKLKFIGCQVNIMEEGWKIFVHPSRKIDLTREIDLIEEIARLVGYDKFQSNLPHPIKPGGLTNLQLVERRVRNILCNIGIQEVTTMSLVAKNSKVEGLIPIKNPLLQDTSYLRSRFLEEHLKLSERNIKSGQKGIWIFEIGNIFKKEKDSIIESKILSGIICGERMLGKWSLKAKTKPLDYYEARGKITELFSAFRLNVIDKPNNDSLELHPGRSAKLYTEGNFIGVFGQLHPSVVEANHLPKETYFYEFDFDAICCSLTRPKKWNVTFKEYVTVPAIERDIACIVDINTLSSDISALIRKTGMPLVENVELIDRYEGENIDNQKCSLAYRITYRSKETLTDEKINPIHEKIRQAIALNFRAELRS